MSNMPKEPGVAVFKYSSSAGYITHVGYLWKPVNATNPNGDWWVIEAKGVLYGVVKTRFNSGGWNRWGKMTKYYNYDATQTTDKTPAATPVTTTTILNLKKGNYGNAVSKLQELLLSVGEVLPKYGVDGDFGSETEAALKHFQERNTIPVTGIVDAITEALLLTKTQIVKIVNGNCHIRLGPGVAHKDIGIAHRNDTYPYGGETKNNWNSIQYNNGLAWVSGKYSTIIS